MFKEKLSLIPHLPGSYQMKNKDGVIIYVGKAKDLHNRVKSYFMGTHNGKTEKLVSEINDFEYIVTSSELEAFILELNLIKKYDPKYNILLKDDKSYPYIEFITKPYPMLKISRYLKIKKTDGKHLFGPYQNAYAARRIVKLLNRLYPLKKCNGIKKELCLYYHIHECLGYCVNKPNNEEINKMNEEIISFLKGNEKLIKNKIMDSITKYSELLNYEAALELKQELSYIEVILEKQKIEISDLLNRDIINYYFDNGYISIQIFFLRNGKMIGSYNDIVPVVTDYIDEVETYIAKFYVKHEIPKEILVDNSLNINLLKEILNTNLIVPKRGNKKKLLDLAKENAKINFKNNFELIKKDEKRTIVANDALKNILKMDKLDRIEVFDNSNLFGTFSVSGMVVFKNGLPSKKDYRKYKIVIDKNDDYHMMKEVIYRRYYRLLMENETMPDLILVDGGINQIHAAKDVINDLNLKIRICGLLKNKDHKTNELMDENGNIISIEKTSDVFHYLTRMQDEVHRYTINYHRTIRSKGSITSILDEIPGIGKTRKKELIKKYGNIKNLKNISVEELSTIIPVNVAKNLHKFLNG